VALIEPRPSVNETRAPETAVETREGNVEEQEERHDPTMPAKIQVCSKVLPSCRKIDRWHAVGFSWITRGSDRSKLRSLHGEEHVAPYGREISHRAGFDIASKHCIVALHGIGIGEDSA